MTHHSTPSAPRQKIKSDALNLRSTCPVTVVLDSTRAGGRPGVTRIRQAGEDFDSAGAVWDKGAFWEMPRLFLATTLIATCRLGVFFLKFKDGELEMNH